MRDTKVITAENLKPGDVYIHPLGGRAKVGSIEIESCFNANFPDYVTLQVDRGGIRIAHSLRKGDKVELAQSANGRAYEFSSSENVSSSDKRFWRWFSGRDDDVVFWDWLRS